MRRLTVAYLVLALFILSAAGLAAQEKTAATPRSRPPVDPAMERWKAAISPGEEHRLLDRFIGIWNVTTRAWTGGPDSPPSETEGIATYEWILQGHYVREETRGQMMSLPHFGLGITGYDNFRRQYVGMWIDTMSTAIYTMSGHLDPAGQVLTMYGQADDPMTGEIGKTMKYVTRFVDDDRFIFEMYDTSLGPDARIMEMVYTRK